MYLISLSCWKILMALHYLHSLTWCRIIETMTTSCWVIEAAKYNISTTVLHRFNFLNLNYVNNRKMQIMCHLFECVQRLFQRRWNFCQFKYVEKVSNFNGMGLCFHMTVLFHFSNQSRTQLSAGHTLLPEVIGSTISNSSFSIFPLLLMNVYPPAQYYYCIFLYEVPTNHEKAKMLTWHWTCVNWEAVS